MSGFIQRAKIELWLAGECQVPTPKMCWFEDSVVAEAPRPVVAPKPAPTPAASTEAVKTPAPAPPRSTTPPLPASPAIAPQVAEIPEIPTEVVKEIVEEVVEEVKQEQEEPIVEEVSNMETYSIEAEDGRRLEISSYVNSSGIRMVEIRSDQGVQMKLSTLQHCITAMAESAARLDEMDALERERQAEFDKCADVTVGAFAVLLITLAVCVYIMLVNQGTAGMVY